MKRFVAAELRRTAMRSKSHQSERHWKRWFYGKSAKERGKITSDARRMWLASVGEFVEAR